MSKLKYLFQISTLLMATSLITASSSKTVTFPSKEVLKASFQKAGLDHFIEKTNILDIVDKKLVPAGVAIRLRCELYDYRENLKKGMPEEMLQSVEQEMQRRTPLMLAIILQSDPEALEKLKKMGLA